MKVKIDRATAKDMVNSNRKNTSWYGENNVDIFGGNIASYDRMFEMLFEKMGFGYAETQCIIGALVLSGADIEYED